MFRKKEEAVKFEMTIDGIKVNITRKKIRNLYIRINRRSGEVRISSPFKVTEVQIKQFVRSRMEWIQKHKRKAALIPPKKEFKYEPGELHSFCGKEYELQIKEGYIKGNIELNDHFMVMKLRKGTSFRGKKTLLENWYREYLKKKIPELISNYEPVMGVKVADFGVKKMKTRWGTCNVIDQRIWLNLELAKRPSGCLEMVVVHEMVHLLERYHNKRFYEFMDRFYPEWRTFEGELNSMVD